MKQSFASQFTVILGTATIAGLLVLSYGCTEKTGHQVVKTAKQIQYAVSRQWQNPIAKRNPQQRFYSEIREKSNLGARLLAEFWEETFSRNRLRFAPPRVEWSERADSALYNSDHHLILLNLDQFLQFRLGVAEMTRTDADLAYVSVLAHEYGHAVQRNLNLRFQRTKDGELQADCFAGAFVAYLRDKGFLEEGDLDEATFIFFLVRDPTGTNADGDNAHGTGSERVVAFHAGVNSGVAACKCNLR